jgi:uncharacterized protein Yka (UPF0111/DUF47 family)
MKRMKVNELLEMAKQEIEEESSKLALSLVKNSLKDIRACEKTLRKLKSAHTKLLDTDVEDLELDDYEY